MKRSAIYVVLICFGLLSFGCSREQSEMRTNSSNVGLLEESIHDKSTGDAEPQKSEESEFADKLVVVTISREEAGLSTIPTTDFDDALLHPDIREIVLNQWDLYIDSIPPELYKAGLRISPSQPNRPYDGVVVSEHWQEPIVGDLRVGADVQALMGILGEPSYTEYEILYYKTHQYYMGFLIKDEKIFRAVVKKNRAEHQNPNLMIEICTSQLDNINLIDLMDYQTEIHPVLSGIIQDNWEGVVWHQPGRALYIYNNYEGDVCIVKGKDYINFIDQDFYMERLAEMLGLYDFLQLNDDMNENQFSSDGRFYYVEGRKRIYIIDTTDELQPYSYGNPLLTMRSSEICWIDDSYDLIISEETRIELVEEGFRANGIGR